MLPKKDIELEGLPCQTSLTFGQLLAHFKEKTVEEE
jgi:hypothetical protein